VALVIGNNNYRSNQLLGNPLRDAETIGAALTRLGFRLVGNKPQTDLKETELIQIVDVFSTLAKGADIAVFYFSGHGTQDDNTNYLIPVDFPPDGFGSHTSTLLHALNVNSLLKIMDASGTRAKIVLLDVVELLLVKDQAMVSQTCQTQARER
jgi:uncharacterized caspase-like protein